MNRLAISRSKPTVVVGLDFGTTFSGFAYALVSDPENIHKFYEWPALGAAGGKHYCKTQTSLLYVKGKGRAGSYVLDAWGYEAVMKHVSSLQVEQSQSHAKQISVGKGANTREHQSRYGTVNNSGDDSPSITPCSYAFIKRFKLLLAGQDGGTSVDDAHIRLPEGLTARTTISDYLRKISELVLIVLQNNLGSHISMDDIQWCLTVPAMWDELAKQEMKACAEIAGLVQGQHCSDDEASPHPVIIVLEPEAASVYCQQKLQGLSLRNGDRFMVVDVGGGTVDLVLHEKVDDLKVREVSPSSGGLCGGSYVDQGFLNFLSLKIKCFTKFSVEHPESVLKIHGWWETIKCGFDGNMHFAHELELPAKLAGAWEEDEKCKTSLTNLYSSFDSIDISRDDMLSIFDPVVDKILELIERKMTEGLKAIMVVGGFSASPYLMNKIRQNFSERVESIVIPKEPGSAICCGAVTYVIGGGDLITSRISKKTYGINSSRPFVVGDPLHLKIRGPGGIPFCRGIFENYVRSGEDVALDQCVSHTMCPVHSRQTSFHCRLYSTSELYPDYVHETGVRELGRFKMNFPSEDQLGSTPEINISMYFGRTTVEVKAVGLNFGDGETCCMPPVTFEKSSNILEL